MSLKIFTLQLTGKIGDTHKLEDERRRLEADYKAFQEAQGSQELQRYTELEQWVTSGVPEQKRRQLEKEIFRGSTEYNQLKELETLEKNKKIKDYLKVAASADLQKFLKVENSEKLKNYWELKDYVEGDFRQEMKVITAQKFVGSPEERLLKELEGLKKNKALKAYFRLKNSPALNKHIEFQKDPRLQRFLELKNSPARSKEARKEWTTLSQDPALREFFRMEKSTDLKLYHKMEGRHVLARYEELVKETGTGEFRERVAYLRDSKKLEKSDAWKKFRRFKELGASEELQFFRKFKKLPAYRNYLDIRDSFQLGRYQELKALTVSPAFRERKAYLEDSRKWEKTEEYARLEEFARLKKHPGVVLFHKYRDSDVFNFLKNWEVTFFDHFETGKVDLGKWIFNTLWGERYLGSTYSQPGDLQGYSGGRNVLVRDGRLAIQVKKEKNVGKRWQPGAGFVPATFDYSSDLLSTLFAQKEGIVEALIKYAPVAEVVSSCHLQGEDPAHQLTLVEMGPECRLGVLTSGGSGKPHFSGIDLKYLKRDKFYIFRLEWEKNLVTWKINDCVVYETTLSRDAGPLHLNLLSLVVQEIPGSKLPVSFEIGWVKCYRRK